MWFYILYNLVRFFSPKELSDPSFTPLILLVSVTLNCVSVTYEENLLVLFVHINSA